MSPVFADALIVAPSISVYLSLLDVVVVVFIVDDNKIIKFPRSREE
jgi:hypothetical protein